jgi:hypothetical protein
MKFKGRVVIRFDEDVIANFGNGIIVSKNNHVIQVSRVNVAQSRQTIILTINGRTLSFFFQKIVSIHVDKDRIYDRTKRT